MSGGTGPDNLPNDGLTMFGPFFGSAMCTVGSECETVLAVGGAASNLYVRTNGAPGLGDSWTFTIVKNGTADTTLQCVVSGTSATTCQDLTGSISFAAGDTISIRVAGSGTPDANTEASWSIRFS